MTENQLNVFLLLFCHRDIFVIALILTMLHGMQKQVFYSCGKL